MITMPKIRPDGQRKEGKTMPIALQNILLIIGACALSFGFMWCILRYQCWIEGRAW